MAALNYARMLGPGDLPGDPRHPNSPSYVEPAFGLDDAACNVADRLTKAGDVGELVYEVADACAVLGWVAKNADIPTHYLPAYRLLLAQSERLSRAVDAEYEALNAADEGEPA